MQVPNLTLNHLPAANVAAVVTIPAKADRRVVIDKIVASYNATPTGGRLTIASDQAALPDGSDPAAKTVLDVDVAVAGPVLIGDWPQGMRMPDGNAAAIITLFAGGAAVIGKLNVTYHYES